MDPMLIYRSKPELGCSGRRGRTHRLWMRDVQVGDVLQDPFGNLRVVRAVTRHTNGDLCCCVFAIRRGSWTNRPYTVIWRTDLMSWRPTGARYSLCGPLDVVLQADIASRGGRSRLTPADVRGVA